MSPESVLTEIYQNFQKRTGFNLVFGVEQEFYLVVDDNGILKPLPDADSASYQEILSQSLAKIPFISPLETEKGPGQFEIQTMPTDGPVALANMVLMLREFITNSAHDIKKKSEISNAKSESNLAASFMAKPFAKHPGSGMHVHVNLTDTSGKNLFCRQGEDESDLLQYAVAGLLETLPAAVKYFAQDANAYNRFTDHGMESPSCISWGADNRTLALRMPSVPHAPHTRRLEHRVPAAGADPYIVFAAIIAGIEYGIVHKLNNTYPKIWGNAFLEQYNLPKLPQNQEQALVIRHAYLDEIMQKFLK